jgi:receptor protein-tyrosine kinase
MDAPEDNTPKRNRVHVSQAIGPLLIETGKLTRDDAERISRLQTEEGLRFGEAAVKLGLLNESDILHALSLQFNHPYLINSPLSQLSTDLVAAYQPFGAEGEKIRTLRSQLQMRWLKDETRPSAMCIVSPARREGRSRLAANLAIAFSQAGERTLLIDGDMRNPSQHILFGLGNQNGLSRLLAGRMDERVVSFVSGLPGLGVLTAGPTPPNPMELLGTSTFSAILTKSLSSFDVVIIDTPSYEQGIDAQQLTRHAGSALAVARTDQTPVRALQTMIAGLQDSDVKVVGSVLIDAPHDKKATRS